jgi:MFS family permease
MPPTLNTSEPVVTHADVRAGARPARPGEPRTLTAAGLTVILVGVLLPMIDFFIVNVALPTINTDLGASQPLLELVVSGYATAYALLLVLGGRLGDSIGRKRLFLAGMAAFTLTSLACGLAPTAVFLVVARAAQGASAAMMVPQVLATIQAATTGEQRSRALARYGAAGGLAAVLGQVLGGLLVSANIDSLGWRPIFLVNVPIGLAGMVLASRYVPDTRHGEPAPIDVPGTLLLGLTVLALLVPLTEGRSLGWPAWTVALLVLAPLVATAPGRVLGPGAAGTAVADAAPQHAPRSPARAAVLRRVRRVHVQLRAARAGRPARQRADGRPRPGADGGRVPAGLVGDEPAAR